MIEASNIQNDINAVKSWKNILNQFVHGSITLANLTSNINGIVIVGHDMIRVAAMLMDVLMCSFHKESGFTFVINDINYRKIFKEMYEKIIKG